LTTSNDDFKLELYRQFWEQARHNEKLRGNFTSFYAVIVAGTLAFLVQTNGVSEGIPLGFLASLSFFGVLVSWRTRNNARRYAHNQIRIQDKEHLNVYLPRTYWRIGRKGLLRWQRSRRGRLWLRFLKCRVLVFGRPLRWYRLDNIYLSVYVLATLVFAVLAMVSGLDS